MLRKLFTTLFVLFWSFAFLLCAWTLTTDIRTTTTFETINIYGILILMALVSLVAATSPAWLRRLA